MHLSHPTVPLRGLENRADPRWEKWAQLMKSERSVHFSLAEEGEWKPEEFPTPGGPEERRAWKAGRGARGSWRAPALSAAIFPVPHLPLDSRILE